MSSLSLPELQLILDKMALFIRRTRLQLKPFFTCFDRHHEGSITPAQFARALSTIGFTLTDASIQVLNTHYATRQPNKVSYLAYIQDVERVVNAQIAEWHRSHHADDVFEEKQAPVSEIVRRRESSSAEQAAVRAQQQREETLTASNVLHKIQTLCIKRRLLINDVFADFDRLRKNVISIAQFQRCLNTTGFNLSKDELECLMFHYLNADQSAIEYKRFISDVVSPFTPLSAEKCPTSSLPVWSPYVEAPLHQQRTQAQQEARQNIMQELGYLTYTRRILIKPNFVAYDTTHQGCISSRQFRSVITALFPIRISNEQLELIEDEYNKGERGIDYVAFLRDIDSYESAAIDYSRSLHPSSSFTPAAPLPPPLPSATIVAGMKIGFSPDQQSDTEIERAIHATLARQRQSVEGIFKDFDRLNKGRVTSAQFFRCLNNIGLKLSATDIAILSAKYAHFEVPEEVDYVKFTQACSNIPKF